MSIQLDAQALSSLYKRRQLEIFPDEKAIKNLVSTDAISKRIMEKGINPIDGQLVGVRLNINILNSTGIAIQSIHKASNKVGYQSGFGFYNGEVITYLPCVCLENAYFNVNQSARENIASGRSAKYPMASIDGVFKGENTKPDFNGIEIKFNPMHHHLFTDIDGFAIHHAQYVTVLGHRAYASGTVTYFEEHDAPERVGVSNSSIRFRAEWQKH